jgi:hypothetical protein
VLPLLVPLGVHMCHSCSERTVTMATGRRKQSRNEWHGAGWKTRGLQWFVHHKGTHLAPGAGTTAILGDVSEYARDWPLQEHSSPKTWRCMASWSITMFRSNLLPPSSRLENDGSKERLTLFNSSGYSLSTLSASGHEVRTLLRNVDEDLSNSNYSS